MKSKAVFVLALLVCVAIGASATSYISQATADKIALNAVGGGTVMQSVLESEYQTRVWAVNIFNGTTEFDVAVNAYDGKVLKIVSQPQDNMASKRQAEAAALAIAGRSTSAAGTYVLESKVADQDEGGKGWLVDVQTSEATVTVAVDGRSAQATTLTQQLARKVISKAAAEKLALGAVGGGIIVPPSLLEMTDKPAHWSINITQANAEYEVWVDAYTGKILNIIRG